MQVPETPSAMGRRRHESVAERQARVGILVNTHMPKTKTPLPRDVWVRWPELRAAKRKAAMAEASQARTDIWQEDRAVLNGFVHSIREVQDHDAASGRARNRRRKRLLAVAVGTAAIGALLFWATWTDTLITWLSVVQK